MKTATITVDIALKNRLDNLKRHSRESYNEVVGRLLSAPAGKPVDMNAVIETVQILSDPEVMDSLARSLVDLRNGRVHSIDEV